MNENQPEVSLLPPVGVVELPTERGIDLSREVSLETKRPRPKSPIFAISSSLKKIFEGFKSRCTILCL